MSDRSTDSPVPDSSASADDANAGDDLEPGGGPQRVVSDQSVDDILDSLDDSEPESSSSIATIESETDDADEREREATRENVTAETEIGDETDDSPSGTTPDASDDSPTEAAAADATNESTADGQGGDSAIETDSSSTVDDAAASLPSETSADSLENLEARVERGTVTGADVRAAEAGDGRETTPEIDEIELSVDDLENPESTIGGGGSSDAGPLAGSIGRDDGDDGDGENDDGKSGLLGRLAGLFSK